MVIQDIVEAESIESQADSKASDLFSIAVSLAPTDAPPLAVERAGEPQWRQAVARSVQDRCDVAEFDKREIGQDAHPRFRGRRVLPALALGASLAMTVSAMAQGQAGQFARECGLKEIAAITVIEDHGAAEDLPAGRLGDAGLTMLRARLTCYEGRVDEALALYESILNLGPVASQHQKVENLPVQKFQDMSLVFPGGD